MHDQNLQGCQNKNLKNKEGISILGHGKKIIFLTQIYIFRPIRRVNRKDTTEGILSY